MKTPRDLPQVQWRDLVKLTPVETFHEATLPLPWLAASLVFYEIGWIIPGLGCSFYFFLTGLRQSHGAQHFSIGLSRAGHHMILFFLSVTMLCSMHAVQASHLHHHRHCLDEEDEEGRVAHLRWWEALLFGPRFLIGLHRTGWRVGNRQSRLWIAVELLGMASMAALLWIAPWDSFRWHLFAMSAGELLTAFFAVWIVHHDCEAKFGRSQRGPVLNFLSYNMFFHFEHHTWPAVPTPHLPELARRLDALGSVPRNDVIPIERVASWRGRIGKRVGATQSAC